MARILHYLLLIPFSLLALQLGAILIMGVVSMISGDFPQEIGFFALLLGIVGWFAGFWWMISRAEGGQKLAMNALLLISGFAMIFILVAWSFTAPTYVDEQTTFRRTAQSLASVSDAAQAAGIDLVEWRTLDAAIDSVSIGRKVTDTDSPFYDAFFGIPNLEKEEKVGASQYLKLNEGILIYIPAYPVTSME